jgi:hypothetical protein
MRAQTVRARPEDALDETGWPWCRCWSLLVDEALVREERDA